MPNFTDIQCHFALDACQSRSHSAFDFQGLELPIISSTFILLPFAQINDLNQKMHAIAYDKHSLELRNLGQIAMLAVPPCPEKDSMDLGGGSTGVELAGKTLQNPDP